MNDNRFNENHGFSTADEFFAYLKDGFDLLYEEGAEQAKLMSIGIHDRLIGRPARAVGLIRFLDYVSGSAGASTSLATGGSTFHHRSPCASDGAAALQATSLCLWYLRSGRTWSMTFCRSFS